MATGGELAMRQSLGGYLAVLHSFERHKYKQGNRYIAFRLSKEGSVKPSYCWVLHGIVNCAGTWQKFWLVRRNHVRMTIKTPNPICRLFFKIDLLTGFAAFV